MSGSTVWPKAESRPAVAWAGRFRQVLPIAANGKGPVLVHGAFALFMIGIARAGFLPAYWFGCAAVGAGPDTRILVSGRAIPMGMICTLRNADGCLAPASGSEDAPGDRFRRPAQGRAGSPRSGLGTGRVSVGRDGGDSRRALQRMSKTLVQLDLHASMSLAAVKRCSRIFLAAVSRYRVQ